MCIRDSFHSVNVKLHPEVEVQVQANVARPTEEADRQAKGEDVIKAKLDEELSLIHI